MSLSLPPCTPAPCFQLSPRRRREAGVRRYGTRKASRSLPVTIVIPDTDNEEESQQPKSKRRRINLAKHVHDTYICAICQETDKLVVASCKNHFTCLSCMSHLVSSDVASNCPLCSSSIDVDISYNFGEEESFEFVNLHNVIPAPRDLFLSHGQESNVKCESKECKFEGTAAQVIRHYFQECLGCEIFCGDCSHNMTREKYIEHRNENMCLNQMCDADEDCPFLNFGHGNKSMEAAERRAAHELFHEEDNDLVTQFENQETYYNLLMQNGPNADESKYFDSFLGWFETNLEEIQEELVHWREAASEAITQEDVTSALETTTIRETCTKLEGTKTAISVAFQINI